MLTTKQARAIIAQYSTNSYGVYTNKTKSDSSNVRRVKCYFRGNVKLLRALEKAAGKQNVTLTAGGDSYCSGGPGIIVKCILEDATAPF
jgi:hypothetical protein